MEIREYAERVLWGESLTLKLDVPDLLTDSTPGVPIGRVDAPKRPAELKLGNPQENSGGFPKHNELQNEEARGRVLHFFANHELLALELMALALLRFPDACAHWRRRLVRTMRDESKHLRLYQARMQTFGVALGSISLNRFFWDQLEQSTSPAQFSAGMSLTFEQANLDFSLYYRDLFFEIGDSQTGELLDEVLRDEVAHVAHGVHYLNTQKPTNVDLFDYYSSLLTYPLTPARAKGKYFSVRHRQRAGLSQAFIDRLNVFTHSKGRVPDVHLFNPDIESEWAHFPRQFTPTKPIQQLTADLETVPMYYCTPEDVVVVQKMPPIDHLNRLKSLGYSIPEFRTCGDAATKIQQRKFGRLRPWGWSPNALRRLKPFVKGTRNAPPKLDLERRALNAKNTVHAIAKPVLENFPEHIRHLCISLDESRLITDIDELSSTIYELNEQGDEAMVKKPFSTAGNGVMKVNVTSLPTLTPRLRNWLKNQETIIVEPYFEKLMEFSYLFEVHENGNLDELGFHHFVTTNSGQYTASYLGPLPYSAPDEAKDFIFRAGGNQNWLWQWVRTMAKELAKSLRAAHFSGPAGLDLMVVRDRHGKIRLKMPSELNLRFTMGHVALGISRPLGTKGRGVWILAHKNRLAQLGYQNFTEWQAALGEVYPTQRNAKNGRFEKGVFFTNSPKLATMVCGTAVIDPSISKAKMVLSHYLEGTPLTPHC